MNIQCMCGATDCSSCGPAQGFGPEDEDGMSTLEAEGFDLDDDDPDEHAADLAADRYERDLDARASQ